MGALILALTSHQLTYSSVKTLGIHMPSPPRTHRSANARENHRLPKKAVVQKKNPIHPRTCIVITQCEGPHHVACGHSLACRDTEWHTIQPPVLGAIPELYLGWHAASWLQFLLGGGVPLLKGFLQLKKSHTIDTTQVDLEA